MPTDASNKRLPLYVLTGFLGSGKTSLLQKLINSNEFHDTAVLINEYGEIGLDHELIESSTEKTVVLKGGCVCCTVREDLAESILNLITSRNKGIVEPFSRLIIETSGLADLVPVILTLKSEPRISESFDFKGTIVTIDAILGAETLATYSESQRQLLYANRAVITKCDLVKPEHIEHVEQVIRSINNSVDILYCYGGAIKPKDFLGKLHYDPDSGLHNVSKWMGMSDDDVYHEYDKSLSRSGLCHITDFDTFSLQTEYDIDWTVFGIWLTMLLHTHGSRILRVKAILNISESDFPVAVHAAQHVVHAPVHMKEQPKTQYSKIVFIVQGLSPEIIRRSFNVFLGISCDYELNNDNTLIPSGAGKSVGNRPRRRPSAPSWAKS